MKQDGLVVFVAVLVGAMAVSAGAFFFFGGSIVGIQKNVLVVSIAAAVGGIFFAFALTFAWYFFGVIRARLRHTTVYEEMRHEIDVFDYKKDKLPGIAVSVLFGVIGAMGLLANHPDAQREGLYFLIFAVSFFFSYFPLLAAREKVIRRIQPR
ncbi:MAG: hypothetical protein HYY60_00285 [Parcubacteria group bacterium]|nr:hypothetical protein [Parcubacteria group bacterium]